jgi:hypothetical protein
MPLTDTAIKNAKPGDKTRKIVDLHLKLTRDLHLILTRPDRPIMA